MVIFMWLIALLQAQTVHAPELISGDAVCLKAPIHACYIEGGDWQALQIGLRARETETGFFFKVGGADIDDNNQPVPYLVEWRNEHKYKGEIYYRGHWRKLCAANYKSNLPCR